jgi:endonuclease YncB( thermonuclease family)
MFTLARNFCQCFSKRTYRTSKIPTVEIAKNPSFDMNEMDDLERLMNIDNRESMRCFSFKGKTFYGLPTNVYDGDTFSLIFIYNREIIKYRCRTLGYDSPEMKPSLENPNREKEIEMAKLAKRRFQELLLKNPNGRVRVLCHKFDKYGRILVEVWNDVDEKSINEIMVEEGHGKKYDGGKKELWDF